MASSTDLAISPTGPDNVNSTLRHLTLPPSTIHELTPLSGPTILPFRRLLIYDPGTILKLRTDEGEGSMTDLAHDLLGSIVPRVDALVSISDSPGNHGILITRQRGVPLVELWPSLSLVQREKVRRSLVELLHRMRRDVDRFDYYGRPGRQPYFTMSQPEFGSDDDRHDFCQNRTEWDDSRLRALRLAAPEVELSEDRARDLERVQRGTSSSSSGLVYRPVLTHGDLSDGNILLDAETLEITGLIDWELANVAPAYFEYALLCISGGHQPEWRRELIEVFLQLLRVECEQETARSMDTASPEVKGRATDELFRETLTAWNAFVGVERYAQGYSDACYWTFEYEEQIASSWKKASNPDGQSGSSQGNL